MKRKSSKRIVVAILTLALVLTGISLDSTTANAKVVIPTKDRTGLENIDDLKNTTITMKVGDAKVLDFIEISPNGYHLDLTDDYEWTTSDESVVSLMKEYYTYIENEKLYGIQIRAEKPGTAVISGHNEWADDTVSFTVTVQKPKMTAKQKKCKHVWKTTKKATCMRSGIKTCKKCKLQKTIAQKKHKFVTMPESIYEYPVYAIFQCNDCNCTSPEEHAANLNGLGICDNLCGMEFREVDYGSAQAALDALYAHFEEAGHASTVSETEEYGKPIVTQKPVTRCTICDLTKEEIEKYGY